jgi:hypothetical protein
MALKPEPSLITDIRFDWIIAAPQIIRLQIAA